MLYQAKFCKAENYYLRDFIKGKYLINKSEWQRICMKTLNSVSKRLYSCIKVKILHLPKNLSPALGESKNLKQI